MSKVQVTIAEQTITFDVSNQQVTTLLNNMQPTNKVAPFYNFLTSTVQLEDKEALLAIIKDDSLSTLELGGLVLGECSSNLEATAKKL